MKRRDPNRPRQPNSKQQFRHMRENDLLIFRGLCGNKLRRKIVGFDDEFNPLVEIFGTKTSIIPERLIEFHRRSL